MNLARAEAEDDRADGDEVAERICGGKGYRGGGRLGGDPLRDVVLAIAMLVKDPRALEVFESDYLKLALKVAGRLNPRFARESDDWWYEWIDFLAGYSDPPGQLEKFYGRAAFPYFLRLTVRNFLRQKYWRRRKEVELESAPVVESSDPLPVKIDIVTEGKMNFARIVHAAVGRLSEVDRLLLALMVVDGLNKQEAAAFVDLSSGQAGRRIKKSLETIHKETRRLAEQHFGDGAFEGMLDGIEFDPRTFADALYGALRKFMEER